MTENQVGVAEQEVSDFVYPVKIEEAGPAAKKLTIEIPHDRIAAKLDEQYRELRTQAAIPGFRVGHAPRKLLERRFSQDVKDQVAATLVRESYQQALEKNNIQVIGEPEFENKEVIKLPEEGPLSFSFQVEVQPAITLPDMGGLKIKKPKVNISEANVDLAMQNLREQQGTLVPVEDRGVQKGDYLVADVHLKVEGEVVGHQHDGQIVARPGRVGGLAVDDLDTRLADMKPGEKRSFTVKAPETHAQEKLRGKDVEIEVALKDIRRLDLAEINQTFLDDLGFENETGLRDALREQMVEKINADVQQAMREQVNKYLLDNIQVEVPSKLSERQADRVVNRRAVDLMMRGMPREQVEQNIERLRGGAQDEAVRELKLFFILQKVAADTGVDVSETELNGRIAMLAAQRDQRPEKLKQEMQKDGSLAELYVQMREQKAVDALIGKAEVEEVEVNPTETPGGEGAAGESQSS